jgi:hypothetical protein
VAKLDLTDLNPAFASKLAAFRAALDKAGIGYNIESGYRTPEQQAEIYARSHQGRDFAAAPPWRSFHNYGLATDIIPTNAADYERMWAMAPDYGLTALKAYDKPHFQLGSNIDAAIKQYNLAGWRPASMPAPAQGAIAYVGGQPSRPTSAHGTTLYSSPLDIVLQAESGDRNINNTTQGTSSGQAQGNAQITTGTWNDFAPKAGVDLKKYPTPDSAPRDIQIQVANTIPLNRWAASTVNKVLAKYPGIDTSQPLGVIQSAALKGSGAPTGVAGDPAASPAPGAPAAGSSGLAGSLPGFTPDSPGARMTAQGLQALTGKSGGSGQDQQPPPMQLSQAPQAMPMGGPMMMGPGGMNTAGRMAAMQALAQQPSAYVASAFAPPQPVALPGQATGMPAMPGTTLNSPSQLQMALMSGQLSPYDVYAGGGFGGGGFGSS